VKRQSDIYIKITGNKGIIEKIEREGKERKGYLINYLNNRLVFYL
tara:strand:- start:1008 stop:1142 length:135 start_codon:yes stop_codon:yes gene_type:complete